MLESYELDSILGKYLFKHYTYIYGVHTVYNYGSERWYVREGQWDTPDHNIFYDD